MTDAELLSQVESAISDVLTKGQAINSAGQGTWTKADLPTLYEMRKDLQGKVAAASGHMIQRAWVGAPARR